MNDSDKQLSPTTASRLFSLQRIMQEFKADEALLWLADKSWGDLNLLTSYYIGPDEKVAEKLAGSSIAIDPAHSCTENGDKVSRETTAQLRSLISQSGLHAQEYDFHLLLGAEPNSISYDEGTSRGILGILALNTSKSSRAIDAIWLEALVKEIWLDRYQRFDHALTATQNLLSEIELNVDDSLMAIGHMVKKEVGAQRSAYLNRNTQDGWREIVESGGRDVDPESVSVTFSDESNPSSLTSIQKRSAVIVSEGDDDTPVELMTVPFLQPGFKLKEVPFVEPVEFIDQLETVQSNDVSLIFLDKQTPGYLQNCFSDTDMKIASSVFGFIEKYASARVFEENSSVVSQYLKTQALKPTTAESIYKALKSLSIRFQSVFALKISEVHGSFEIDSVGANPNEFLSNAYLSRLKGGYLKKFYSGENGYNVESMYVGIEPIDGGFDLEVHFPGEKDGSKLFIARYRGNEISQSILRSFINLFNELFIWDRKAEHQSERASYLMQVRHAVIHHFAAAHRSLKSLRPLWERGARDKEYWEDLRDDPLVSSELKRGFSSLGQANLIIENGRFILGDIDPSSLNRKPYRITETIKNVLEVLQDNREEKGLVVISKVIGGPPKIMNADEPLISIALMNLFDNAIKYAPYHSKLLWQLEYKADRLSFSISSVGQYLDPGRKHLLFQVGFRGKQKDRLNQRHGTGLGLPVAYRILKAHSPIAELDYVPISESSDLGGSGTMFFFDMPYLTGQSSKNAVTE